MVVVFYNEGGRCAHRILDGNRSLGYISLTFVVFGRLASKAQETGLDLLPQFLPEFGLTLQGQGDSLPCRVVYCRSQAAGGQDDIAAFQGLLDGLGDAPGIVAYRSFAIQVNAHIPQVAGNVTGVGVDDFTE